jgi:RNA polymerase sigma-70 factor (sigma-E family)
LGWQAARRRVVRLSDMGADLQGGAGLPAEPRVSVMAEAGGVSSAVRAAVTAVYQAHALGLIRLAHVMLGDRAAAEDVVQEAFCGLYRRWDRLAGPEKALAYVRSSVLNGCRSALRRKQRNDIGGVSQPVVASAESAALAAEERREVMRLLRRLPDRQREVLVLRFYLELSDAEIARQLGIRQSTVRSTTHRALAALARALGEGP